MVNDVSTISGISSFYQAVNYMPKPSGTAATKYTSHSVSGFSLQD